MRQVGPESGARAEPGNRTLKLASARSASLWTAMLPEISREAPAGIVAYAEQNGIDHIVMGTGDKRGISRLVLGSVAAEVSGRAHCSVTVAR